MITKAQLKNLSDALKLDEKAEALHRQSEKVWNKNEDKGISLMDRGDVISEKAYDLFRKTMLEILKTNAFR
jgi:hypothetical protein